MAKLTNPQKKLLGEVVEATQSEAGCVFVSLKNNKPLEKLLLLEMVEINDTITNEIGDIACRATELGVSQHTGIPTPEEVVEDTQPNLPMDIEVVEKVEEVVEEPKKYVKPTFEIETGYEVPKTRRGGRGRTLYPFDHMEIGESFHVAPTEKRPDPNKNMASTVSSANRRFKLEGITDRKFVNRRATDDDPKGEGCRVHCIAVEVVD